jgi:DNA-binding Lrp family transcriptional regulator
MSLSSSNCSPASALGMNQLDAVLDELDRALIAGLRKNPHATLTDLARSVSCARGTAITRLRRLEERGVIVGYGPDIVAAAAGYGVLAFTTLAIAQGAHMRVVAQLRAIPEVLEIHTVTGGGDLLCRIAARSNDHLHDVLQRIVAVPEVVRTDSQLALSSETVRTVADLVALRP